jgi:hypothetical protein
MASAGETIESPVAGERFKWHQTAADTGGRLVRHEGWVRPGGGVRLEHVHRHSEERFELLIETMFRLAREGKTDATGRPHPRYLLVMAREFEDEVYVTRPPLWVQRLLLGAVARVGRAAGVLPDVRFA